jgi:biotin carboxylase
VRVYVVASKVTDSVTHGFLPAARGLGLDVMVLTDRPADHKAGHNAEPCDVHDPRALIAAIGDLGIPDAVFSNSDHLQTQTALAAEYFGLPGKDWRSALRAKNKALMRRHLAAEGVEDVRATTLRPARPARGDDLAYPLVVKPAEGVASEDVFLVKDQADLRDRCEQIWSRRPGQTLLAEEYLPGQLRTLETVGDGHTTWTLGGFRTDLSRGFIEERLTWEPDAPGREHVTRALTGLGVGFGACHTEYVTGDDTRLIEVNDRAIGDHCDFLLGRLAGVPLFELILKIHLGERLPKQTPSEKRGIAEWVLAHQSGTLVKAPTQRDDDVEYWPIRHPGDSIRLTGTNRDYLGTILACGPDPAGAIASFRAAHDWVIE